MERYVIHVTKKCNMKCVYCYEKDKESTYSWKEVKELLDNIIHYNKEKTFGIEFLGGEPMLAFGIIKAAYFYLESKSDILVDNYCITTNGTILTDEMIEFIKQNKKIYWAASMDGTKWMNCLRIMKDSEKNSYEIVVSNIKKLLEQVESNRIQVHMVTHPYNVHLIAKGIDHLYNIGIRSIGVGTVENTITIGKEYCLQYISQLDTVSKKIHDNIYPDLRIDVLNELKPRSDNRYYMYDENNKLIAESYGRADSDITKTGTVNAISKTSPLGSMIEDIREIVYLNHQKRMGRI